MNYESANLFYRRRERSACLDCASRRIAPQAAGVIHTDFERGFIRAQVMSYEDFIAHKGEAGAKKPVSYVWKVKPISLKMAM